MPVSRQHPLRTLRPLRHAALGALLPLAVTLAVSAGPLGDKRLLEPDGTIRPGAGYLAPGAALPREPPRELLSAAAHLPAAALPAEPADADRPALPLGQQHVLLRLDPQPVPLPFDRAAATGEPRRPHDRVDPRSRHELHRSPGHALRRSLARACRGTGQTLLARTFADNYVNPVDYLDRSGAFTITTFRYLGGNYSTCSGPACPRQDNRDRPIDLTVAPLPNVLVDILTYVGAGNSGQGSWDYLTCEASRAYGSVRGSRSGLDPGFASGQG